MTKVYLLWHGYEDVLGVFSTYELAEAYRDAELAKSSYKRSWNYSIIEEIIDAPST